MLRFLLRVVDFYALRITEFSDIHYLKLKKKKILVFKESTGNKKGRAGRPLPVLSSPLVLRPIDLLTGLSTHND